MSSNSESVSHFFPPGVVDGTGRRIRPGTLVQFNDADKEIIAEVVAWRPEGLVLFVSDAVGNTEEWYVRLPIDVIRMDIEAENSVIAGEFYVEVDGPSTIIVQGVGTRDLVYIPNEDSTDQLISLPDSTTPLREWSNETLEVLRNMEPDTRKRILKESFRAPILERVLQEAVLPRVIEKLVLVTTDQEQPHPQDTVHCADILELWLEAHGHLVNRGEPDLSRRWIKSIVIFPISKLPHVVDAVTHIIKSEVSSWVESAERIVVVHGGGTPAMNMAVLIATSRYSVASIRHVQVPEAHRGTLRQQPLIEFDLDDMPELGKAINRD